jgi:hypothetical protein
MKIAAITDDGKTTSQQFGRAAHYLVLTDEVSQIVDCELRNKLGHAGFHNGNSEHARQDRYRLQPAKCLV